VEARGKESICTARNGKCENCTSYLCFGTLRAGFPDIPTIVRPSAMIWLHRYNTIGFRSLPLFSGGIFSVECVVHASTRQHEFGLLEPNQAEDLAKWSHGKHCTGQRP
jgi:hypothetical protein